MKDHFSISIMLYQHSIDTLQIVHHSYLVFIVLLQHSYFLHFSKILIKI